MTDAVRRPRIASRRRREQARGIARCVRALINARDSCAMRIGGGTKVDNVFPRERYRMDVSARAG